MKDADKASQLRTKKPASEKPPNKKKKAKFSEEVFDTDSKQVEKSKTDSKKSACLFCEKLMGTKGEDVMENHYSKECPYLIDCPQCGLLVEVMLLQTHLYGSCEFAPSDPKAVIIHFNILV